MSQNSHKRGMRPHAGNEGRYIPIVRNGHTQWARDQVTLQADVLVLLGLGGGMPKKRIIIALETCQDSIEKALAALLQAGKIERYRAMSVRRRMDEHWCVAGQAPAASRANFRAMEILAAFQQAAARQAGSMSV
ncbi:hypothetical protein R69746_05803 [Paraburkholderia aspalathi]|uniref:hypothetical protein n=1 Tax=Paraburkholderia aspalathi TaxID=1324617 RepID=UPI00190AFB43|nr:hypothetical protein [Paraburkholderia aspalathi]MBK3841841.1 hypothetical protein [Paraburkholderia aspalathi]CAE6815172.1 hypothetical protein R69746_05803 [Paraburkholderia aspalathi]